ncbi:hypothetical protein C5Y93_14215 [Blastopirellula marina]|uniref:Uncharacterized protein n=1 Tax=Blastopirellula marina TaxID=124 RepID=A0A2S8GMK2_9BACT|nr:hypothetical protein C5Y93_14215 [Blastopirellula marina]
MEHSFVEAADELLLRQGELLPLVTTALGRSAYDYWIGWDGRGDADLDAIDCTVCGAWAIRFHGLELNMSNLHDGRSIRIDFGPRGRPAFTASGIGHFVVSGKHPWRTFPDLKAILSGSHGYDYHRCADFCESLLAAGLFERANPELYDVMMKSMVSVPGEGNVIEIPPEYDRNDLLLCDTLVLSDAALAVLKK